MTWRKNGAPSNLRTYLNGVRYTLIRDAHVVYLYADGLQILRETPLSYRATIDRFKQIRDNLCQVLLEIRL